MKANSKKFLVVLALSAAAVAAPAAPGIINQTWSGAEIIPDNNASGVAFNFNLAVAEPLAITQVEVSLNIAGGWNGDLYAYLSHGSGFSVLLNRPGRTAGSLAGSGVSGLNLTLGDSYATDVHTAANNPLTGNFVPDGRAVNPFNTLDTDARSAFLSSFNNLDPNGSWTLFFADVGPLAVSTIQSWSVNLAVVSAVPEPGSAALIWVGAVLCAVTRRKRQ